MEYNSTPAWMRDRCLVVLPLCPMLGSSLGTPSVGKFFQMWNFSVSQLWKMMPVVLTQGQGKNTSCKQRDNQPICGMIQTDLNWRLWNWSIWVELHLVSTLMAVFFSEVWLPSSKDVVSWWQWKLATTKCWTRCWTWKQKHHQNS